ncbi:MAG: FtsW/RodA/SpoVE family cell cycle protein [Thermus sp.]|uniref:FtsW/RodA/SpoVE family cell cycle protein n=1 Tax=Thermus sp. TaxID=275 RepID=UPI0025D82411|nr:FtsW/RodA/SpoVE family cell cycle protein [Thermus sp.]MCS6869170.1 FtsW/RodA/SpoVE family cell cycle protein [Thermus sp.]MCS7219066.1 FtsW/RodA/SpoVE family cell cycle protein [Thermus sp.]MDW8017401.1 FtsW/RodA/SpoVE family cell cycle protein [Thermus sp.]MDW8357321.1 FtsW/RodA/SpoVE family cell cycle protein [Thermus sp.]
MDPVLLLSALLLMAFGLLGVGVAEPELLGGHLLRIAASLAALGLGFLLPPQGLLRWARPLLWATLGLLVLVLFLGDGPGGVRRWFYLGPMAFQPSELAKVALVLYLASFVARKGRDAPILGAAALVGVTAGLVLVEPDFATALFLLTLGGLLFVLAGVPWRRLVAVSLAGFLAFSPFSGYYFARFQYVSERFANFLDYLQGEASSSHGAYQVVQAQKALLLAGPLGHGPGGSLPHLPEGHNDMVFASVVFATGWLGGGVVLLLYLLLFARGLSLALSLPGSLGLLALGLTLYLTLQAALNIGVTMGFLPVTGVPLPLVSYGGSSLLVSGLAVGILLRLAREGGKEVAPWSS